MTFVLQVVVIVEQWLLYIFPCRNGTPLAQHCGIACFRAMLSAVLTVHACSPYGMRVLKQETISHIMALSLRGVAHTYNM